MQQGRQMCKTECSLVPERLGPEIVAVDGCGETYGQDCPAHTHTAFAGTGFNPDNPQHQKGSDALRYAIAIQQARDDGDFARADAIRDHVRWLGYDVGSAKDRTTVTWRSRR